MEKDTAAIASRIRISVRKAGGGIAVAAASGIPLGSLNNYIHGRNRFPFRAAIALAKACNVTLDWLATGEPGYSPTTTIIDPILADDGAVGPMDGTLLAENPIAWSCPQLTDQQQRALLHAVYKLSVADHADAEIGPFVRGFIQAAGCR